MKADAETFNCIVEGDNTVQLMLYDVTLCGKLFDFIFTVYELLSAVWYLLIANCLYTLFIPLYHALHKGNIAESRFQYTIRIFKPISLSAELFDFSRMLCNFILLSCNLAVDTVNTALMMFRFAFRKGRSFPDLCIFVSSC